MKLSAAILVASLVSLVASAPAPTLGERDLSSVIGGLLGSLSSLIPGFSVSNDHWKAGPVVKWELQKVAQLASALFSKSLPWVDVQVQASTPWRKYKANGVNMGGWFELENSITPEIFEAYGSPPDEWTLCGILGANCGPLLENHYATYFTRDSIDLYAKYGINTLRVPMTYQAWINVPGSQLYHGKQTEFLRNVVDYAVSRYGMKVIIGLHSLPGGVNSLDIGEALFHKGWFNNAQNLQYSFQAVQNMLAYIATTSNPLAYAISPLNEASDDLSKFGSAGGLSDNGVDWVTTYLRGVLKLIKNSRVPQTTMFVQDCFKGPAYFAPFFDDNANIIIDSHIYFFAAGEAYSNYLAPSVCGLVKYFKDQNIKFPLYIGGWSLQSRYNNTFASRKVQYQTQVYAYTKNFQGGSSWNAKHNSSAKVDGEGVQRDYWSLENLIKAGVVNPGGKLDAVCCSD